MANKVVAKELYRVVSTAIVCRNGKYLLVKRSEKEKAFPGKWTVPGGGLHQEDYINTSPNYGGQWYFALDKSLRRELREEVNLEIGEIKYLLNYVFIRPDGIHVTGLSFYAKFKSGKIKLEEGLTEYAWVTAKEARNYDLIPGILDEIKILDKLLTSKK